MIRFNSALGGLELVSDAAQAQYNWSGLGLRGNLYAGEAAAGMNVASRAPLSAQLQPGYHIYVVDDAGDIWTGPPDAFHSSIVPRGAKVHVAGNLLITPDGTVYMNAQSGHFMAETPFTTSQETQFVEMMVRRINGTKGLRAGRVSGDMQRLPRP